MEAERTLQEFRRPEKSVPHHQQIAVPAAWRETFDRKIELIGWKGFTRIDQPEEDVAIYTVDATVPSNLAVRAEGPPTFSLSVCLSGYGTYSIDGALPLDVKPGFGVLFTSHRYAFGETAVKAGERFHFVDLRFESRFLVKAGGVALERLGGDLLSDHSRPDQEIFLVGFQASAPLLQAARDIAGCRLQHGLARQLYLYSKAIECLSLVVDAFSQPLQSRSSLRDEDRLRVQRAQQIIEAHYDIDWTIARLAREVGVNERKLKEGFRQVVGNSVHAHLREVRIDVAAALLAEGKTVTEAAFAVGFSSLSHFSKAFAAVKGVQPSRYRK
jgi:AraC-like DNA-binding protein